MKRYLVVFILIMSATAFAGEGWWMTEPVSLIQTNLRETDSGLDAGKLVEAIRDYPANTILFSVGGITAHYPTNVEFHYRSPWLPEGKDLVGDVITLAHENDMRVIGRFDFSRAIKKVYDAHPEWFFRTAEGNAVHDDNDLYSICINGDYYHQKAMEILTEALERYPVDGLFFNWFGNIRSDYQGHDIGLCHCEACEAKFRAQYGRPIPGVADEDYNEFIHNSAVEVAKMIKDLIAEKRPGALFMTYIDNYTDGIVSEADYYKWRSLPQWIYSASEHVNRALNSQPDKMAFDLVMPYEEMRYRFASVAGTGLRAFLYQNMAQGAFPAFVVLGTMDQPDMTALKAVRPVFQYYDQYKQSYVGQKNAARVILYARQDPSWNRENPDHRGFYRLLSELHIPFRVTNRIDSLEPSDTDLVVVPNGQTPPELREYIEKGGHVLVAGTTYPGLGLEKPVKLWTDTQSSYMRISDHTLLPSLRDTKVLFWEGSYLELAPSPTPVTLIPPGQFGPPDKVATLETVTDKPGLVIKKMGNGELIYIPWEIGRLYYRFSNDKHRLFVSDLFDHLLGDKKQLITNAHPLVEISLMRRPDEQKTLVHLINLSGHSGTAFFETVPMRDISIRVKGEFSRAETMDGKQISIAYREGYSRFNLPELDEYKVICLYQD